MTIDSIQFPYNWVATTQATAFWLTLYNRPLHWKYINYLLYLGDRRHLIQQGNPITGDRYICVEGKPILLSTVELLHHKSFSPLIQNSLSFWRNFFSAPDREGNIKLVAHPGNAELARSMELVIANLYRLYQDYSLRELGDKCMCLLECEEKGYPRGITIYTILAKNGYNLEGRCCMNQKKARNKR